MTAGADDKSGGELRELIEIFHDHKSSVDQAT